MLANPPLPAVLLVDDEPHILSSLQRLLRDEFEVLTAPSAARGLELLQTRDVQVIITDQRMPGMSGTEFLARLQPDYPNAARIILTAYADLPGVIDAVNTGQVYRYLVKPWNPEELVATVRQARERYRLLQQNRQLHEDLLAANAELEQRVQARTAELADANARLRELNRLKDEFLAITSHDLRAPLGSIRVGLELLASESCPPAERQEYFNAIRQAAHHLLNLIDDLLDLAKIESGAMLLERSRLRASEVARRSVAALAFNAQAKRLRVELHADPAEPELVADELKLFRVFNNLLSNAIKFTPAGGHITLRVAAEAGGVQVSVTDTGLGLQPADLPLLFEKYKQARTRATQGEKGTGLGLALSRQLVELHGGRIEVTSQPGQGSVFTVHLPVSAPGAP